MDLAKRKYRFIEQIMTTKHVDTIGLLEQFKVKLLSDNKIVGYTSKGNPLTMQAYKNRIQQSELSMKNGKHITQEDIEEKFLGNI